MPHITYDISLGSIMIILSIMTAAIRIGIQIGQMQTVARIQGEAIAAHTTRLNEYEQRLVSIFGEVQRLIGRMESTQDRLEKATGQRLGERGNRL